MSLPASIPQWVHRHPEPWSKPPVQGLTAPLTKLTSLEHLGCWWYAAPYWWPIRTYCTLNRLTVAALFIHYIKGTLWSLCVVLEASLLVYVNSLDYLNVRYFCSLLGEQREALRWSTSEHAYKVLHFAIILSPATLKQLKQNGPQTCIGNRETWGRSLFSPQVTICSHMASNWVIIPVNA